MFKKQYNYLKLKTHKATIHLIDYRVNRTFICIGEQKKKNCVTCFTVIITLLWQFGTWPVISMRCAYIYFASDKLLFTN